ncbi:MAG: hypothetical protein WBV73_21160 [Phormidium sp.]
MEFHGLFLHDLHSPAVELFPAGEERMMMKREKLSLALSIELRHIG